MDAIASERLEQIVQLADPSHSKPQVVVLDRRELRRVTSGLKQRRLSSGGRGLSNAIEDRKLPSNLFVLDRVVAKADGLRLLVDQLNRRTDDSVIAVLPQERNLALQAVRFADVVGVDDCDQFTAHHLQPALTCPCRAEAFEIHDANAGIAESGADSVALLAAVAVVHDEIFEIAERLRQHAGDGLIEICGVAEERGEYRHRRIQRSRSSTSRMARCRTSRVISRSSRLKRV